jgi:hypothetical protein
MAEKKNEPSKKETAEPPKQTNKEQPKSTYTMHEVLKITDDLFALSKEREYPLGAFVHGLVFALEFAQQSYNIPPQQLAEIKRDCRRYVDEIVQANAMKTPAEPKKK